MQRIDLELHPLQDRPDVWWYSAAFERLPVTDSGVVEILDRPDDRNPDARFWRWIANQAPGVVRGSVGPGPAFDPNANVDFVVVGYSPKALVEHFAPGSG